jgi:hypothetical protein
LTFRGRYSSLITAVGKNGAKDKAEQLFEEAAGTLPLQQGEAWPNKFVYAAAFGATKVDFKRSLRCGRTLCKGCPGCGCANWGQFIHVGADPRDLAAFAGCERPRSSKCTLTKRRRTEGPKCQWSKLATHRGGPLQATQGKAEHFPTDGRQSSQMQGQ